jgi:hypothetical protein
MPASETAVRPVRIPDTILRFGPWLLIVTIVSQIGVIVLGTSARQGYQQFAVDPTVTPFTSAFLSLSYAIVGAILTARLPRHPIGWLLTGVGLFIGIGQLTWFYVAYSTFSDPPLLPNPGLAAVISQTICVPVTLGLLIITVALFPDGRPASERWRLLPPATTAALAVYALSVAFAPGDVIYFAGVPNPIGLSGLPRGLAEMVRIVTIPIAAALATLATASLFDRYRRADADQRRQLLWIGFAATINAITSLLMIVVFGFTQPGPLTSQSPLWTFAWPAFCIGASTIPIACLFAITRYRLYEIDRIINGAFVYAALVAILAGLYAGLNELLKRTFVALTGQQSDVALVITTLILATTLTPVRQWLERVAARRLHHATSAPPAAPAHAIAGGNGAGALDPAMLESIATRAADLAAERVMAKLEGRASRRP